MSIGQTQVFLLAVGFTAVVGWVRGWQREVITCAIVLATVLFLSLGLGDALAQLFTHGSQSLIPTASAHPLSGGGPNGPSAPGTSGGGSGSGSGGTSGGSGSTSGAYCSPAVIGQFLSNIIFVGMTFLGYRLG
ncbi:MAG TPA: hypothetical protein VKC57_16535, partial [Ktedonobacterales bacterium]|nr:hypothetical protein [Ktedonobacterales bacterium]